MADEMNGIEKLRKLASDMNGALLWSLLKPGTEDEWNAESIRETANDTLRSIADQIEREHVEAINAKIETICTFAREVDRLKEGTGRDLTGEAREAVERLRAIPHEDVLRSANLDSEIVDKLCKAVGVYRRLTYTDTLDAICNRIIELIEHGGRHGADVAALRELAGEMEGMRDHNHRMWSLTGDEAHHGAYCALSGYPQRIRDAVDGAPKPDAEREAAADWVAEQGGLDEVKHHYAFMVDQVANRVGIERGADEPEHVTIGRIMDELDKRLMPPGMEWPRFEDGEKVGFGSKVFSFEEPCETFIFRRAAGGVLPAQRCHWVHGHRADGLSRQAPRAGGSGSGRQADQAGRHGAHARRHENDRAEDNGRHGVGWPPDL